MRRGQALVEFALILPILLFTILGGVESGFLLIAKANQDRATQVVADWAADRDNSSWHAVANKILPGCTVEVITPLPDLIEVTSRCQYRPKVLVGLPMFDVPISSRQTAVGTKKSSSPPSESNTPSETPDGSPSS